jgi:hypothetical protein
MRKMRASSLPALARMADQLQLTPTNTHCVFTSWIRSGISLTMRRPDEQAHEAKDSAVAELHHRFVPSNRMKVHRVQESAVQVEGGSFRQVEVSRVCVAP